MIKTLAKPISWGSLVTLIASSILFFYGRMDLAQAQRIMLWSTVVWFVSAGLWMWNSDSGK